MINRKKIGMLCFIVLCSLSSGLQSSITWSDPTTISSTNIDASDPQVVIDSLGNATAVWVENNLIKASTQPVNGSWSASTTISNVLNGAFSPRLGVDSSGNVTAIWLENGSVNGVVNASTLTFGGSWSVAVSISSALGGASSGALAVDASGNAVAVWVRGTVIESSTEASGTWSGVTTLSASSSDSPQVAIGGNSTVVAVWHSVVSGADVIMSATKTLGGNWATAKGVFTGTAAFNHNYPKIAVDLNGNAVVAWFRYNHSTGYQNVQVLTSTLFFNASSWTIGTILSDMGIRNPADLTLKVAFDSNGNAIAFWTNSYDGQVFYIASANKLFGGVWSNFIMPNVPSLYMLSADIAVNSLGDGLAAYMFWDGDSLMIQSQETDIASPILNGWTMANNVSQGTDNGYPRCALTLTGNIANAVAVWLNFNGNNKVVQAASGIEAVVVQPTNVNVVQNVTNLGVYNDYYNTITWTASPSPNLIQYTIYRNGVFFMATDPNTLQVIDHNAVQSGTGSVTYGVAAFDSNRSQSSIATVTFH